MQTVVAATAGWTTLRADGRESTEIDPNYLVLAADTHIGVTPDTIGHGQNMYRNLQQVVARILNKSYRPTAMIINGDCSFNIGERESYVQLSNLLAPLRKAGVAVHMAMGNHDHRSNFYSVFSKMQPDPAFIENRHILILDTQHAYLFILDSLVHVENAYSSAGLLGREQRKWLNNALAEHSDKPVHVLAHHNPRIASAKIGNALEDQSEFFKILSNHPQVHSYIFGHAHIWNTGNTHSGAFELVGQPATGYIFRKQQPRAYLDAHLSMNRLNLKLEALDTSHPWHGEKYTVTKTA